MFTVKMSSAFTGVHMGLCFVNGTAKTDDAFTATRLASRGYDVTEVPARRSGKKAQEQTPESDADILDDIAAVEEG